MTPWVAIILLGFLLFAPIAFRVVEHNLEAYFLVVGLVAATLARIWSFRLIVEAARAPMAITLAVVVAGLIFGPLSRAASVGFNRLRGAMSRPLLVALCVVTIGLGSCLISSIVAGLVLAETVGLLGLGPPLRNRVVVAGCFAIGIGSALTPAGGPFSAIVASGLNLGFLDLSRMIGLWLLPGVLAMGIVSAWFARGDYDLIADETPVRRRPRDSFIQGLKVFVFVAGLTLVSAAFAPLAAHWIPLIGRSLLYWTNITSAALDNSALAALEVHGMNDNAVKPALLSMVISGGILIPGNIPNIVCAGILGIRSREWAEIGIPVGLVMLGIYFALLRLV